MPAARRSSKDVPGSFGAGKGYLQPGSCSQALKHSSQARLLSGSHPAGRRTAVALTGRPGKLLPYRLPAPTCCRAARVQRARRGEEALRKPGARRELTRSLPAWLRRRFAGGSGWLWHRSTVGRGDDASPSPGTSQPLSSSRANSPWSLPANFTKPRGKFPIPSCERSPFNQPPVIQFGHEPKRGLTFPARLSAFLPMKAAVFHVPPPASPSHTARRGRGRAARPRGQRGLEELLALRKVICSW